MRIRDGLHLVASGRAGFDLTHPLDCNVFMLDSGAGLVLFDAGAGCDPDRILDEIRAGGADPRAITTLYLTHGHADHSGGVEPLRKHLPDVRVIAGPRTADLLAAADERLISLDRARGRIYPHDYVWTAPDVDAVIQPGVPQQVGDLAITFVDTPGHSDDHGSYLVRHADWAALVSGDALFADGKVYLQDIVDCSVSKTVASLQTLADLAFDRLLPGHGAFSLAEGHRHAAAARRYADAGVPPPQLF